MTYQKNDKTGVIRTAAITALAGNAILAVLKITAGLISHSGALIGDGLDSSADVFIGVITLIVVRIISKPADECHPWGHGRAETVATAFLSFVIFFMGVQLIVSSVSGLISGEREPVASAFAIVVTLISIVGKMLLALCQYSLSKRAGSAMLRANAKNMACDTLISLSVLIGLVITRFTGSGIADAVIAVLIGLWVIKTAVSIFLEANLELMDGSRNMEPYRVIADAVNSVEGAVNPHRARMRRVAEFWDIDLDIEIDPKCTVLEAHIIASRVEDEIKRNLENVFDIVIHIEPRGDDADETFGLSENVMRGGQAEDGDETQTD